MKLKCHIYALYLDCSGKYVYCANSQKLADDSAFIYIESNEVEFDEPSIESLQSKTVAAYKLEQQRIRAEAHLRVAQLQESIDKMLCLENKI